MGERNKYSGIEELINKLKKSREPISRGMSASLKDLYYSGKYKSAILSGPEGDFPRIFKSIITMWVETDGIQGGVYISDETEGDFERVMGKMKRQVNKIPLDDKSLEAFRPLATKAINDLTAEGLNMVAGVKIDQDPKTGLEIVSLHYPKSFMNVFPVPEKSQSKLGLSMATYFLKNAPFMKDQGQPHPDTEQQVLAAAVSTVTSLFTTDEICKYNGTYSTEQRDEAWNNSAQKFSAFSDKILGLRKALVIAENTREHFSAASFDEKVSKYFLLENAGCSLLLTNILIARLVGAKQGIDFLPILYEANSMTVELGMEKRFEDEKLKKISLGKVIEAVLTDKLKLTGQAKPKKQ